MAAGIDLPRLLRRLKPERRSAIPARADADLHFAEDEPPAGPPLLLDTCVYIHVLRGRTPPAVDRLLTTRTLFHCGPAIAELSVSLGARVPAGRRDSAARRQIEGVIADMPPHRVLAPDASTWAAAGILSGIRARIGGFPAGQEGLVDALILLQASGAGAAVLTANIRDFDVLQQIAGDARVVFYREAAPAGGA